MHWNRDHAAVLRQCPQRVLLFVFIPRGNVNLQIFALSVFTFRKKSYGDDKGRESQKVREEICFRKTVQHVYMCIRNSNGFRVPHPSRGRASPSLQHLT